MRPGQENASDVPNQRLIKAAMAFARVVAEQRVNGIVAVGRSAEPAGGGVQVPQLPKVVARIELDIARLVEPAGSQCRRWMVA